jgi:hypothetical protein
MLLENDIFGSKHCFDIIIDDNTDYNIGNDDDDDEREAAGKQ